MIRRSADHVTVCGDALLPSSRPRRAAATLMLSSALAVVSLATGRAQTAAQHGSSSRERESIAVAMNGEYLPTLGVSTVSLAPVSSRFTVYFTPPHPKRRRYKLEGVDPLWREGYCEMTISVRFFDAKGEQLHQDSQPFIGETPGWNASLEHPVFASRTATVTVPPGARSFWVVISSAGPPETLGTLLVKGVTVTRLRRNDVREVVMRAPISQAPADNAVQSAPFGFTADGIRPKMASLLRLSSRTGGQPEECFAIIDDDVRAHAEWRTLKENAPEVTEGDRLDVEWQESFSVGAGLVWVQDYDRPSPGTYPFRVQPVDLLGRPDGEETALSIAVLAPWWQQGWVWGAGFAGLLPFGFGVQRYVAHRRLQRQVVQMKEEALRKAELELIRIARATTLGEFTASIAHEISQPLSGITTNANACMRWLNAERANVDEARAAAQRIVRDGQRAAQIVTRIRALLAKEKLLRESSSINAVIEELLPLLQPDIQRRGAKLECHLSSNLPAVAIDRVQIQQVIMNLVVNGLDAMNRITDRPRILRIHSGRESENVFVAVEDSGIGIDATTRERLFDRFFTTKPGGLGMGLAICRSIIESHGGELSVEPNKGAGATFRFTLPVETRVIP